jgi:hypothetical protein
MTSSDPAPLEPYPPVGAASPAYIFETSQRAILCPCEKQTDLIRLESPRIWTRMMSLDPTDPAYVPLLARWPDKEGDPPALRVTPPEEALRYV